MLASLTYYIYKGRREHLLLHIIVLDSIILIVLEKSCREQTVGVCDVNSRRRHEEERDILGVHGEFLL